jgi:hypothetical protein
MKKITTKPGIVERVVEKVTGEVTEIIDTEGGYIDDLGHMVCIICTSFIYYGKLTGVNQSVIQISDPYIVYETGDWKNKSWTDAQKLPTKTTTISTLQIESMSRMEK